MLRHLAAMASTGSDIEKRLLPEGMESESDSEVERDEIV